LKILMTFSIARLLLDYVFPRLRQRPRRCPPPLPYGRARHADVGNPFPASRRRRIREELARVLRWLYQYLQKAKTDQEKWLVQQEIEATDVKIDALVYDLYGLTEEEIQVIEESVGK